MRVCSFFELARNAQRLFATQAPREKRRLLNFVLSNCTWEDGAVVATFREPFDLLAETTAIAARSAVSKPTHEKYDYEYPLAPRSRHPCRLNCGHPSSPSCGHPRRPSCGHPSSQSQN